MPVAVRGSGDVGAVGEEGAQEIGFAVESGVYGRSEEDFGEWRRCVGEEGREFEGQ